MNENILLLFSRRSPIGENNFVNTSGYEVSEKLQKMLQSSVSDLFPLKH